MQVYTITLTTEDNPEALAKRLKALFPQILACTVGGPYNIVDFTEKKS